MLNIFQYRNGLQIIQTASLLLDEMGELQVLTSDGKIYYHNGTIASPLVTEAGGVTITNKNLVDNSTFIIDNGDGTIRIGFNAAGTTGTTTTLTSSQTVNRVITFPDATDTLVGKNTTDILTNKTIDGGSNTFTNIGNIQLSTMPAHTIKGNNTGSPATPLDLTGTQVTAELVVFVGDSGSGGTKGLVIAPAAGDAAAGKFLKADGTWATVSGGGVVIDNSVQTLSNKSLVDNSTFIIDNSDPTKRIGFDAGGTTATTSTIRFTQSANRTIDFPDASDVLVGRATSDNLFNKILDPLTIKFQGSSNDAILFSTLDIGSPAAAIIRPKVTTLGVATITTPALVSATYELLIKDYAQIVTNKDIDGGTATNTSRLTLPKATKSTLDALTRKQATIVYATDQSKAYVDNGSQLVPVGSGSGTGGVNFIGLDTSFAFLNSDDVDAENSTGNWATYADAAGPTPVDMTGGSATSLTLSRTTTSGEVLNGSASFKIVKTATNAQGMGVSVIGNVPTGYRGANIAIKLPFKIISGSLVSGDLKMFIYDVTNSAVITPYNNDVVVGQGFLQAVFPISTTTAQIRFGFHFASTSATAVTFSWDDVFIGNQQIVFNPNITDFEPAGATIVGAVTTPPTKGTVSVDRVIIRQDGDCADINVEYIQTSNGSAGSGVYLYTLSNGLQFDLTKIHASTTISGNSHNDDTTQIGNGSLGQVGGYAGPVFAYAYDATRFYLKFVTLINDNATAVSSSSLTAFQSGSPVDYSTGTLGIRLNIRAPIAGWSTSIATANSTTFNISPILATGTRVTTAPANLGEYRSLYKASSSSFTLTDVAPTNPPTVADGIQIYSTAFGVGGTSGQINRYEIFIGKNKNFKTMGFATSGKSGYLDITPWTSQTSSGSAVYNGLKTGYNSSTGILIVDACADDTSIQASDRFVGTILTEGTSGSGTRSLTGYFDVIVSENVIAVQLGSGQNEVLVTAGNSVGGSSSGEGTVRNFKNVQINVGGAIQYVPRTTTTADYFKILEPGVYTINYYEGSSGAAFNTVAGIIKRNDTSLTTSGVEGITFAQGKLAFMFNSGSSSNSGPTIYLTSTTYCNIGDIIRAQAQTDLVDNIDNVTWFHITKVS